MKYQKVEERHDRFVFGVDPPDSYSVETLYDDSSLIVVGYSSGRGRWVAYYKVCGLELQWWVDDEHAATVDAAMKIGDYVAVEELLVREFLEQLDSPTLFWMLHRVDGIAFKRGYDAAKTELRQWLEK